MFRRALRFLVGPARDPLDAGIHHKISLIAFLAWVGIGADGLSSSCYGPEACFLALGPHRSLAVFMALATGVTVAVISAGYSYVIEAFPGGGGGYIVASRLLGEKPGLVAGSALLVDYVLTISISIASGVDYLFSPLPPEWHGIHPHAFKLPVEAAVIIAMVLMNLRGVKESVLILLPIFLTFLVTHLTAIAAVLGGHSAGLPAVFHGAWSDARGAVAALGWVPFLALFLSAYSKGAGTYTGVEAVSNSMQILREPKVATGRRTMLYLALSLAIVSAGILLGYLLLDVQPVKDKTLNAVLLEGVTAGWGAFGRVFVPVALVSAAALLFVAAQSGFIDGPRVMANMAIDGWMPRRFQHLSDRLVIQDGVLLMGGAGVVFLLATGGSVETLVILYSINVFVTFVLSQAGMVRHWWAERARLRGWWRRLLVNAAAFVLCAVILAVFISLKWLEGAWVTMAVTAAVCAGAWFIRRHYRGVASALKDLDILLTQDPTGGAPPAAAPAAPDPAAPTAVLMVSGFNGLGMHSFLSIARSYPGYFKNWVFVMVGVVDYDRFRNQDEVAGLKQRVQEQLDRYAEVARRLGAPAETCAAFGVDAVDELEKLCTGVARRYARANFFGGQLVFREENVFTRMLHSGAIYELQRRLHFSGIPLTVLPVRVFPRAARGRGR